MFLDNITTINLHWSADCNIACKYCYIEKNKTYMVELNNQIREALVDGSFVLHIQHIWSTPALRNQITALYFQGAEPTVNADLFAATAYDLLDYFPNVNQIMFSTNALLSITLYKEFLLPLYKYCEENTREITLTIQLSLDGPLWINDGNRYAGATANTLRAIEELNGFEYLKSEYFKIKVILKPTITIDNMREMDVLEYFKFFNNLEQKYENSWIEYHLLGFPTLVIPGDYTKEDGLVFSSWLKSISEIDRKQIPAYGNEPLFHDCNDIYNPDYDTCTAGKTSLTIDFAGNLYICTRICRFGPSAHAMCSFGGDWDNKFRTFQEYHHNTERRKQIALDIIRKLAAQGEIDSCYTIDSEAEKLYNVTLGILCPVEAYEYFHDMYEPHEGIFKLFGNGALGQIQKIIYSNS